MLELTVFTPTYNRAHTLSRLYHSLCMQSNDNFEWLIVDDGSTDSTEELIKTFISDRKLCIRYVKQLNGGKHRAINVATQIANGFFFYIVDSDDYLPSNAIDIIMNYASQIKENSNLAGLCGLRAFPNGEVIAGEQLTECIIENTIKVRKKYHIYGDMAEIFKTDVLRLFPFPEYKGEKFITEAIVWNRIATQYSMLFFHEIIYIGEYLPGGLTNSIRKHFRNNPRGTMLYFNEVLKSPQQGAMAKIKAGINYWRYTFKSPRTKRINEFKPIWWTVICIPIAYFFYLKDSKHLS